MKLYSFALIFLLAAAAFYSEYWHKANGSSSHVASGLQGNIHFEKMLYEFGIVTEGEIINHSFRFSNIGKGPIRIVKTKASCGCTTSKVSSQIYQPGDTDYLKVSIDTADKHGIIVKYVEVYLENNKDEKVTLTLLAQLVPPPHPKKRHGSPVTIRSKCKTCHLDAALNLEGVFLYHKVCTQCHGRKGVGRGSTVGFATKEWQNSTSDDYIKAVISKGVDGKGMPPFVSGVTPPLSTEQVGSLIKYIRTLKEE